MVDKIGLGIAVMAYGGQVHSKHVQMWLRVGNTLAQSTERFGLKAEIIVDTNPVDRARNFALAQGMVNGCDWLLMVDADTWVEEPPSMQDGHAGTFLLRMISDADRAEAAIVVAPVQRRIVPGDKRELMVYSRSEGWNEGDDPRKELAPIERISPVWPTHIYSAATAVMAINLRWLADHEIFFHFTPERSEDHNFCRDVRAAGGKILCDGRVRTGHQSKPAYLYSDER